MALDTGFSGVRGWLSSEDCRGPGLRWGALPKMAAPPPSARCSGPRRITEESGARAGTVCGGGLGPGRKGPAPFSRGPGSRPALATMRLRVGPCPGCGATRAPWLSRPLAARRPARGPRRFPQPPPFLRGPGGPAKRVGPKGRPGSSTPGGGGGGPKGP